jgi:hypothetical protein
MAKTPTEIRSKARSYTDKALKVLSEIMMDPSAPATVRAKAATEILNRGQGVLPEGHAKFVLDNREFYVYSIQSKAGELIYIGKGRGRRSIQSAMRLGGLPRIRATFSSEKQALLFEKRLIQRFKPINNFVYNRDEFVPFEQQLKQ